MKEINFYRSESEKSPVEEFLDNLTAKQAKKVVWVLNMVEEHINVSSKYFKKIVNRRTPCSKSEFLQYMPPYLRQATLEKEGRFLQDILSIINAGVGELN